MNAITIQIIKMSDCLKLEIPPTNENRAGTMKERDHYNNCK
jgi:hypothetical protein